MSDWFKDDVIILGTLQQSRQAAKSVPVIPGYDDLHELGRGGQGVVFNALQRSTRRNVAIKVLLDVAWGSETRRRRFEREIELIASLHHPNIVQLYDSGVTEVGYPYYVMEFVDGVGLDKLIGSGVWSFTVSLPPTEGSVAEAPSDGDGFAAVLPLRSALDLFAKVCEAVHYAHQHGVIHRDLKPSNIRVDGDGDPHVLDFGLAKASGTTDIGDNTDMSRTGEFMGSLPWASPEQAEGRPHGTDVRTDVYSLGVLLYQLLTGRFPYPLTGSFREVLDHIQKTPPTKPSSYRRDIDDEVETITLKCLAKEPDRRYHSVGELGSDIRHYLAGEPVEAKRDSTLYTLKKTLGRYRHAARALCALVVLALLGAVLMSVLWLRALEAEQLAAQRRDSAEIARSTADDARERAQKEATHARAISQYLIKMLSTPLDKGRDARVADALDDAAAQLDQNPGLGALAKATLQQAIGNAYASLGLYDQADPLLESALDTYRRERGNASAEALDGLASVAWLHRQKGELDEAETQLRTVLDGRRRLFGEDKTETAQSMNDLAYVLEQQGRLDEAEPLHRKALGIFRRVLGDEALDTLTSMGNLASVLSGLGRMDEAQALMRQRLDTARRVLGENHRDTVRAMSSYAALLSQTGQYEEGAALTREVYEANRRMLGDDHPETIVAAANVAITMGTLGKLPDAEPLLRDTLARARRVLGSQHPDTLTVLSSLAAVLMARGELVEAEGLLREARDISAQLRGATHYDTLYHTNNLADCLQRQGKSEEAVQLFRQALDGCRETLGDDNPYTLTVELNLGAALAEAHQFDAADELIRAGLAGRRKLYGDDSIEAFTARLQLAILACERGAYELAEEEFQALLDLAPRVAPPGHWYPAVVRSWYGEALLGQQRFDEAEKQLTAAYEQLQQLLGDKNPRTQKTIARLVHLYEAWDKPVDAARYRDLLVTADANE